MGKLSKIISKIDDIKRNKNASSMAVITGAVASGGLLGSSQADASMIGQSAKTFNKAALEVAQAMEKQGAPMEAIRKTTGYQFGTPIHRGADGKWRQEIGDFENDYESYARLAGEEEARQTQKRIGLSMKDRIDRNPDLDFDTPPEQQIVRGQAGSATTPVMAATGLTGLGLSGIQALNGENAKQIYKFADKRNKRKMLKAAYENTPFYKGVSDISSLVGAGDVLRGIMAAKLAATGKMNEYPGIDKQISDAEAMKT